MKLKTALFKTFGLAMNGLSYLAPQTAGRLTFRLFGTPPRPNIRPKEAAFLATGRREDLDFQGKRIVVYYWGEDHEKTVFCAYGWGYNAGRWRHYVPALVEAGYRVVAFDPLGHGNASYAHLNYPLCVAQIELVLRHVEGCDLVLAHSFGGGCLVEALRNLPRELHPERGVFMAIFSEVRWLFHVFAKSMGLRPRILEELEAYVETYAQGRTLDDFDVAQNTTHLPHIQALIVHDPDDTTTGFRNAERNHGYWVNSALYAPRGAGHNLGTPAVTRVILDFLISGSLPPRATVNRGDVERLPPMGKDAELSASGGVSDYYQ